MHRFITWVVFVVLSALCGLAQVGDWAAVEGLAAGTDVSVKTKSGRNFQGAFESANVERMVVEANERAFPGRKVVRREIVRDEVKEVRLNRRGTSALAGAAIGLGVGIGVGVAVDAPYSNHEDRGLVSGTLGALGALVGAGIGKTHPFVKGKLIYAAP